MSSRLPYLRDDDPRTQGDTGRAVRERRGGTLLNLDRMLLYSEPLAAGWNAYLGALRRRCSLPGKWRELAIVRVALLTRAGYEYAQHAPEALACGVTQAQLDALAHWERAAPALFDDTERAVLAYTDAMTLQVQVSDAVYARVHAALGDTHLVELTATVAAYNMVARFLEALQVTMDGEAAPR